MDTVYETHTAGFVESLHREARFHRATGASFRHWHGWELMGDNEEIWSAQAQAWRNHWD